MTDQSPPAQDALPLTAPGLTLDGFDRFAEDHVRELHEARSAAARTLLRWQKDDTLWRPQEAQALHNASTAYQHACQALDVALSASPGSPAHLDALSQAAEADRAAAAALHTFEG